MAVWKTRCRRARVRAAVRLLALDTSTEYCSVALLDGDSMTERVAHAGQSHSELLLPMVHEVLREKSVALRDLDGIAFGAGPGSFTGLRIACGVTQGLAFGAQLRVAAASTLMALAEAEQGERIYAALDARMGEVYCAAYVRMGADWRTAIEPCLASPAEAPIPEGSSWLGVGTGFRVAGGALAQRLGKGLEGVHEDVYPQASAIARIGVRMFARGEVTAAALALPVYLRDKVAFTERERKQMA